MQRWSSIYFLCLIKKAYVQKKCYSYFMFMQMYGAILNNIIRINSLLFSLFLLLQLVYLLLFSSINLFCSFVSIHICKPGKTCKVYTIPIYFSCISLFLTFTNLHNMVCRFFFFFQVCIIFFNWITIFNE